MPSTDTRSSHAKKRSGSKPGAVRWIIPIVLVLAWLGVMGVGGPTFGKISDVVTNSQADFLPVDAQATEVQDRIGDFSDSEGIPAIIVAESEDEISRAQIRDLGETTQGLTDIEQVTQVSPPIPSEDGQAVEIIALVDAESDTATVVEEIRSELGTDSEDGLNIAVSGPAGLVADLSGAFAGIDGLLLIVALVAVLVILVLVYRSPILPFLVLITSMAALCGAILTVYWLAKEEFITLSGQTQGILSIIVIGAATDYGLLYTARFREALHQTESRWHATRVAWKGTFPAVMASGTTVIAGLLCLLLSALESNRALGPVTAIGVVFAILAGLTLLPALLAIFGRVAMWPRIPKVETVPEAHEQADDLEHKKGLWPAVARLVDRKSRTVWIICAIGLGIAAVGASQLDAGGVPASEFVLGA
ncbi:MAG: MMPL family transporter, partial [Kocuria sp.]|nr:MMPL family transporter [Kocuria sp.]